MIEEARIVRPNRDQTAIVEGMVIEKKSSRLPNHPLFHQSYPSPQNQNDLDDTYAEEEFRQRCYIAITTSKVGVAKSLRRLC